MYLCDGSIQKNYRIKDIKTEDEELKTFLFSLGCFSGENIFIIRKNKKSLIVIMKDAKYSMDIDLTKLIEIF